MPRPPDALPTLDHLDHANLSVPPLSPGEINALRSVLDRLVAASETLTPPTPTDLIPIREAAALAQIHPCTLRNWIHRGQVTRYGRPTAYRVSWSEVMPRAPARPAVHRASTSWRPGQHVSPVSKPRKKKKNAPPPEPHSEAA